MPPPFCRCRLVVDVPWPSPGRETPKEQARESRGALLPALRRDYVFRRARSDIFFLGLERECRSVSPGQWGKSVCKEVFVWLLQGRADKDINRWVGEADFDFRRWLICVLPVVILGHLLAALLASQIGGGDGFGRCFCGCQRGAGGGLSVDGSMFGIWLLHV